LSGNDCPLELVELDPPPDELPELLELLEPQAEMPTASSPVIAAAIRLRLPLIGLPPVVS
jgi:hypothetical protein